MYPRLPKETIQNIKELRKSMIRRDVAKKLGLSISTIAKYESASGFKKYSEAKQKYCSRPLVRTRKRRYHREYMRNRLTTDVEFRREHNARVNRYQKRKRQDPEYRKAYNEKCRIRYRNMTPEQREHKRSVVKKWRKRNQKRLKAYVRIHRKEISESQKMRYHSDPEFRQKVLLRHNEYYHRLHPEAKYRPRKVIK